MDAIAVIAIVIVVAIVVALVVTMLRRKKKEREERKRKLSGQEAAHRQEADAKIDRARSLAPDVEKREREAERHEAEAREKQAAADEARREAEEVKKKAGDAVQAANRHDQEAANREDERRDLWLREECPRKPWVASRSGEPWVTRNRRDLWFREEKRWPVGDGEPARITPYRNGPYLVRGPFTIADQDGNEIEIKRRVVALCRCGRSRIRPFCDGTHKAIGFRAESGSPGNGFV